MPRLRRPRHPQCRAARPARNRRCARCPPQPLYLHLGYRMLVAVHLLHEDLRVPLRARTRHGRRHGRQDRQPPPLGVGDDRRRRLPGHRRKPLHPRHPPQCRPQCHPLQQRDLRTHQGAVLPHLEAGQDHQDVALRNRREALQPRRTGHRRQGYVLRPYGRHGGAVDEGVSRGGRPTQGNVGLRAPSIRSSCATAKRCSSGPTGRRVWSSRT